MSFALANTGPITILGSETAVSPSITIPGNLSANQILKITLSGTIGGANQNNQTMALNFRMGTTNTTADTLVFTSNNANTQANANVAFVSYWNANPGFTPTQATPFQLPLGFQTPNVCIGTIYLVVIAGGASANLAVVAGGGTAMPGNTNLINQETNQVLGYLNFNNGSANNLTIYFNQGIQGYYKYDPVAGVAVSTAPYKWTWVQPAVSIPALFYLASVEFFDASESASGGGGNYQVDVLANGTLTLANANVNFNNTTFINVSTTANGTAQVNVALNANQAAILAGIATANSSNINVTLEANGQVQLDTRLPPGGGGSGNYEVDVYANGSSIQTNANLNFINSTSMNAYVLANGTTQVNVTYNVNTTMNLVSLNVSANISNTGNLLVSQNTFTGNLTVAQNTSEGNLSVTQNASVGNLSVTQNTSEGNLSVTQNAVVANILVKANIFMGANVPAGNTAVNAFTWNAVSNSVLVLYANVTNAVVNLSQTSVNISQFAVLNVAANISNAGNLLVTQNSFTGNLSTTQNTTTGNLSVTQNTSTGNLSVTQNASFGNISVTQNVLAGNINVSNINVSQNISNTGNLLVTQNTFSGNLSITQNVATGNISVTQNLTSGNISATQNASVGNLSATQNISTGNLSVTQNTFTGNANVTANLNVSNVLINQNIFFSANAGNTAVNAFTINAVSNTTLSLFANVTNTIISFSQTAVNIGQFQLLNVAANISNVGNLLVTQNTFTGNLSVTQNASVGNLSVTQNILAGNLSITTLMNVVTLNVSQNISNAGNLLVSQNSFTGNLSVTQNASFGNISVTQNVGPVGNISAANVNVSATMNAATIAGTFCFINQNTSSGNLAVTQNTTTGNLNVSQNINTSNLLVNQNIYHSANAGNFAVNVFTWNVGSNTTMSLFANVTNTILNVSQTSVNIGSFVVLNVANATGGIFLAGNIVPQSTGANVPLGVYSANASNIAITYQANGEVSFDTRLPPGGGGGGNYEVDVYANGSSILANANLNFINSTSMNAYVLANGTTQANVSYNVNSSAVIGSANASNLAVTIQANGQAQIDTRSPPGATPPAAPNSAIQFDNNGVFGGSANLTFNLASNVVTFGTSASINISANTGNANPFGGANGVTFFMPANNQLSVAINANSVLNVTQTSINVAYSLNVVANISNTGNLLVTQNTFTGNLSITQNVVAGNINVANINVSANVSNAGNVLITQNLYVGNIITTQNISGGNLSITQNTSEGNLSVTQNISGGNIAITQNANTGNINVSQNVYAGNIIANGIIQMNANGSQYDLAVAMGVMMATTMRLSTHMGFPIF